MYTYNISHFVTVTEYGLGASYVVVLPFLIILSHRIVIAKLVINKLIMAYTIGAAKSLSRHRDSASPRRRDYVRLYWRSQL